MDLSQRVKALRISRGLTQKALSALAGIAQPSLSVIESGKTTVLKADTVMGLCSALNTNPNYLINGVGPMGPLIAVDADVEELQLIASKLNHDDLGFLLMTARALRDKTPSAPSIENPFANRGNKSNV